MWNLDVLDIGPLAPAEQLWIIAYALEQCGWPRTHIRALGSIGHREPAISAIQRSLCWSPRLK